MDRELVFHPVPGYSGGPVPYNPLQSPWAPGNLVRIFPGITPVAGYLVGVRGPIGDQPSMGVYTQFRDPDPHTPYTTPPGILL